LISGRSCGKIVDWMDARGEEMTVGYTEYPEKTTDLSQYQRKKNNETENIIL
jgi:hypothetical protein